MRISVEIDDGLMREAMRCSGARTKRDTVEQGLRALVGIQAQQGIRRLRGKVKWEGDLDVSRLGRILSVPTAKGRSKPSPLDVKGVKLGVTTADLVAIVRKGRERG